MLWHSLPQINSVITKLLIWRTIGPRCCGLSLRCYRRARVLYGKCFQESLTAEMPPRLFLWAVMMPGQHIIIIKNWWMLAACKSKRSWIWPRPLVLWMWRPETPWQNQLCVWLVFLLHILLIIPRNGSNMRKMLIVFILIFLKMWALNLPGKWVYLLIPKKWSGQRWSMKQMSRKYHHRYLNRRSPRPRAVHKSKNPRLSCRC